MAAGFSTAPSASAPDTADWRASAAAATAVAAAPDVWAGDGLVALGDGVGVGEGEGLVDGVSDGASSGWLADGESAGSGVVASRFAHQFHASAMTSRAATTPRMTAPAALVGLGRQWRPR